MVSTSIFALPPRTHASAWSPPPFTGTCIRRLDAKYRLVLPVGAARAIRAAGGGVYVLPSRQGVGLEILPEPVFEESVLRLCRSTADTDDARRHDGLVAAAERVVIRGPGRVTLPPRYRGLFPNGHVLVIGCDLYLEVVDAEQSALLGTAPTAGPAHQEDPDLRCLH
jgi:DNA-binding transcriptional regulator/RsmH inhibitor MraZ